MSGIQEMRERRTVLALATKKLLDDNPAEKWNADHQKVYDANTDEIDRIDAHIKRYEKAIKDEVDTKLGHELDDKQKRAERDLPETDPRRIFTTWMRHGERAITAEQWASIRNTMSTTTAGEGGYTVQTEVARTLIDALKEFGGMRAVSDVFSTDMGNPMNFPTSDGTSETGELIAENTTATGADPSFNTVALNVYKFSSKIVAVPIELLQDSGIDIEAFVRGRLAQRLGRITNQMFTTGTGSSQPRGVVVGSVQGKVGTTGQTVSVIYDDLVDLIHSIDPAYRAGGRCGFMMNDASLKVIRKLKDSQNRPLWEPNIQVGQPSSLLGYAVTTNQDVAVMAANAKSILFGDFSYYKVRDVMSATLFRFTDSAYAKLGQVGFLAWMRSGGNLVDTAAVKHYANSAT